jgi:hypothetical protein
MKSYDYLKRKFFYSMGCAMMTVYRLENEQGYGPYYHRCTLENEKLRDELISHNDDDKRPGLWKDMLCTAHTELDNKYNADKKVLFAFETLAQLKAWFIGWVLEALKEAGYRIKAYRVAIEDTATTVHQTIFTNGIIDHEYI